MKRSEFIKKAAVGAFAVVLTAKVPVLASSSVRFGDNLSAGVVVGAVAPISTRDLWIDTSSGTGITKYWNGSTWKPTQATWG